MNRHLVFVAAAVALAAPCPAHGQTPDERADRVRERVRVQTRIQLERFRDLRSAEQPSALDTVVPFDAHGVVTVSCYDGDVIITSSDRNEVRVHARSGSGPIRFVSSGGRATLESSSGRRCSNGRFEVVVPTGARVSASTWGGSVNVHGVGGSVDVHAQSGDIMLADLGGRMDAESISGDVIARNVQGDVSLKTISGDIQLATARGDVELATISGDIDVRGMTAKQVRTHSTSGDIAFAGQILDGGRYEFSTHSGDILLHLPSTVGAQLSISTFNGSIQSAFPIVLAPGEYGIGAAQARRLEFTLGHGTARLLAETFSGDVVIAGLGDGR